jgi:hypothetical protein
MSGAYPMIPLDAEPSEAQKEEIIALIARNNVSHNTISRLTPVTKIAPIRITLQMLHDTVGEVSAADQTDNG